MVFDRSSSGLAWAPASLDLTNELIRMYNSTYKAGAAATPGKGPTAPAPKDAPK
jgi:outer membrane protein